MGKGKKLNDLLTVLGSNVKKSVALDGEMLIEDLNYDSRLVKKGDLFFAVRGVHADGHQFLPEVDRKGARAALVEKEEDIALPQIKVPSVMAAMSPVANKFFEEPSQKIPVVGITGTNGKTTITYLLEDILKANAKTCGVMGTINYRFGGKQVEAPNTTPMAVDVQRFLARLVQARADAAVMEVSSHALVLGRVADVNFQVGVFTNLTQDHLDFHKNMESYFEAKASLFRNKSSLKSVINIDDEYGRRLIKEFPSALRFGLAPEASVRASEVICDLSGIQFSLQLPSGKKFSIKTNLMGRHNVSNCLAAAGAAFALGLTEDQVVSGLHRPHAIPGRLERVEAGQKFVVVVDYAHTHDALEKVLTTLKETGPRRLLCVFGAGGDRDRTKRPKMGRVATQLATKAFVTSDNPRSEDPGAIIQEIEQGIREAGQSNYSVHVDREEAIRQAIGEAMEGDIVLIAGKGHETYQIIGDKKIHFSDQETARLEIVGRRSPA